MKRLTMLALMLASFLMVSCGAKVEVPPAFVGKIQTRDGMSGDVRVTSKFRLPMCWSYCDKLVLLDVSDQRYTEEFSTFMPKDDLTLKYGVSLQMSVSPDNYDFIYANIPAAGTNDGGVSLITQATVYTRYVEQRLETVLPAIVADYTIDQVASNRDEVNTFITSRLREELSDSPFVVKFAGLTDVVYPSIIIDAKEKAAERREQEEQLLAERTLALLAIQTEREVEESRRDVELAKAATKAMIAEQMMTPAYETLLKYETLQAMAASSNKIIVPTDMLDGLAVQNQL